MSPVPSHQSPVPSDALSLSKCPQSPVPSHQSPVTSPQSPVPSPQSPTTASTSYVFGGSPALVSQIASSKLAILKLGLV
ncbi:MAG: hypothetical protein ACKPEO_22395 [Sphaerospermopsis kisseleviana]